MNRISPEKEGRARAILLAGESLRFVATEVGINRMTAWSLRRRIIAETGPMRCACGKPAGHYEWCGHRIARSPGRITWMLGQWRNITTLNIYVPSRPRYERPEIPHERETEIPLLVNSRRVVSLDAPVFDLENSHTLFKSAELTPLEILLLKEERQSEEWQERQRHISEWNRYLKRKQSAFYTS